MLLEIPLYKVPPVFTILKSVKLVPVVDCTLKDASGAFIVKVFVPVFVPIPNLLFVLSKNKLALSCV